MIPELKTGEIYIEGAYLGKGVEAFPIKIGRVVKKKERDEFARELRAEYKADRVQFVILENFK